MFLKAKSLSSLIVALICCLFLSWTTTAQPAPCSGSTDMGEQFWYWGQTASEIESILVANNGRIAQIRIDDPSIPTFSVSIVQNEGAFYTPQWFWYYGIDASFIPELVGSGEYRLISIDPYYDPAGDLKFCVVGVYNEGCYSKGWWWNTEIEAGDLNTWLASSPPKRLIEFRPYMIGNNRYFSIIAVENEGSDGLAWEYWYGESIEYIQQKVGSSYRITNLAPDPLGGWDALLLQENGQGWGYWFGQSAEQCFDNIRNSGLRFIDFSMYNGGESWTCTGIGDSVIPQDQEI